VDDRYEKYTRLKFDRPHDQLLRVRISAGTKHNLMDPELHQELGTVWHDVEADKATSAVLLAAEGENFSSGGNIKRSPDKYEFSERLRTITETQKMVYNMINCPKPIVSAVRGWAVGAGLAAALLADICIVAKDAKLLDGHTRIGVAAGDHAVMLWPLLCGMAKSKYYLLTCDTLGGEEAERIGLVAMAVDNAELDDKALEVAVKLARGAPNAISWTKHALNNWFRQAGPLFDASMAFEMASFFGPEVLEGRKAVLEKRPADFHKASS
jgi:enoyl-CoA hydratase